MNKKPAHLSGTAGQIADHFNISKQQCSRVLRYDIWKEVL